MKTKPCPILVNGGIDTKTNPKLVQAPALLELENQYQQRTGELRTRNGFNKLGLAGTYAFETLQGGIGEIVTNNSYRVLSRISSDGVARTVGFSTNLYCAPLVTAAVAGIHEPAQELGDQTDPDMAVIASGVRLATWTDAGGLTSGAGVSVDSDLANGAAVNYSPLTTGSPGRPIILVYSGAGTTVTKFLINLTASPSTVSAVSTTVTPTGESLLGSAIPAVSDLSQAQPWFDAKAIPGTANVAMAWRANGGGITCAIYNTVTGAVTSSVNTAAADASFCLGWLDDQLSTGNMYLATAGSAAGVVVRTMSPTTMVVSATNTIDAGATVGVRNITGHIVASATNYTVLWDVSGSSTIYDKIRLGRWTGSATLYDKAAHHSLASRSYKFPDGQYYVLGAMASTVQPHFALYAASDADLLLGSSGRTPTPLCYVMSGEGGGRRNQCSLASMSSYGGSVYTAVTRKRKISTPSGVSASQGALVQQVVFTAMTSIRPRELGGSMFLPGGILTLDDGTALRRGTFPIYPEAPTLAQGAGGALTLLGLYSYRCVFRMVDATGRVMRSAGSVPTSITLTGANNQVTVTAFNLREAPGYSGSSSRLSVVCEVYRQGPSASGATLYNKVGEATVNVLSDTITFVDQVSDISAAAGEVAYFNGNTLENFNPPSCSLLEVNGNRVGIVNAEDPTEFWYSKEYKAGVGIGFYPDFKVRISGDGAGGLTALAAMDGRWILFKRSAIYVLSGDGPNDLGQGSFNAAQAVSRNIGTVNPSSVIETPDGIMFEAPSGGIWLLDRGLGLSYVGAPVEQYTLAEDVAGAASVTGLTTVRFVLPSGRMLEWDYHHKRWYTHQLRVDRSGAASTVTSCVKSSVLGWSYMLANGDLMSEAAGQTTDVNGTTTGIIPRIGLPVLQLAGLAGYQRLKGVDLTLDVVGNCTLSVDAEFNFSGALTGTPKTIALTTATPTVQVQYNPPDGLAKCTAVRLVITVSGNPTGGTFRLTGATANVGVKQGSSVADGKRMA